MKRYPLLKNDFCVMYNGDLLDISTVFNVETKESKVFRNTLVTGVVNSGNEPGHGNTFPSFQNRTESPSS